jgi:hypothetical protein
MNSSLRGLLTTTAALLVACGSGHRDPAAPPVSAATTAPATTGIPATAGVPATSQQGAPAPAPAASGLTTPGQILFSADFETSDWHLPFYDHYGLNDGRLSLATAPADVHGGASALRCAAPKAAGAVASVKYWFGDTGGYDKVHLRWWAKFEGTFDQGNLMHFSGLGAISTTGKWDFMGQAGIKPNGDDRFSSGFEPWRDWGNNASPGVFGFYSYFADMKADPNMPGKYWGNSFRPTQNGFNPPRGEWHCYEIMVKANDSNQSNGEQAAWIDGKLYGHYTDILWRTVDRVKLKRFSISLYIHDSPKENVVFFDDVVLSTGYIGP